MKDWQQAYDGVSDEEYESAAEWCAKRGLTGKEGDPLPTGLSDLACFKIGVDPQTFQKRVREHAYGLTEEGER